MAINFAASTIFFSLSNYLYLSSSPALAVTLFMALFLCLVSFLTGREGLSTLASHISRVPADFGSAWAALLNQALFGHRPSRSHHELGVIGFDEAAECAVCLCEIDKGEEVRELNCQHRFHRVCIEQWMNHSHLMTCPLCRGFLAPPPMYEENTTGYYEEEVDVVYFRSFSLISDDGAERESDRWWLR